MTTESKHSSYHGPFHIQHRYWPGLFLLVQCSLFLIYAFNVRGNTSINLLAIAVSTTGLIVWISFIGGVYINKHLQRLETLFIVNALILSAATLYVQSVGGSQAALTYTLVHGSSISHFYWDYDLPLVLPDKTNLYLEEIPTVLTTAKDQPTSRYNS